MTSCELVYRAFLSKVLEDEWGVWTEEEIKADMSDILDGAIPYFKFPKNSTVRAADGNFEGELTPEEIQILATYMKCEWLDRSIMTWENVKPLYAERDFSQANLLDKLKATLEAEELKALRLEGNYYRSVKGKPFDYTRMASKVDK